MQNSDEVFAEHHFSRSNTASYFIENTSNS